MRYPRVLHLTGLVLIVTLVFALTHYVRLPHQATDSSRVGTAAAADNPQRRGGPPPSTARPPGPPAGQQPSAPRPSGPPVGQHPSDPPPSGARPSGPPSHVQPRSVPHTEHGTAGTAGHVPPPGTRPAEPRIPLDGHIWRGHAPDAPSHQRVYPVPGIHDHPTPRAFIPYHHYPRPYYSFYPRYWLGFGVYVGYPLDYPLLFGYPNYIYDGGIIDTLPPAPAATVFGGLSLEITPGDAVVVVEGVEVGIACDFAPTEQPLTLRPGRHHIELRAPGLQAVAFDVDIVAGKVVPFSGVLQPR